MVLGGLQKSSLIDYPGKISCVLFLSGCNFDCPYCHNPDLAKNNIHPMLNENSVYDFLEKRKDFLDGVVISGGEPTLQKDLISLCEKTKQMGYPVKIDTNGSRPHVIKKLINEGLVDYIAMDIKTDPLNYSPLIQKKSDPDNIFSSIRIIMESNIDYEFRTTCIKPLVDANIIDGISRLISGSMLYALQQFNSTKVLHPEYFHKNECAYNKDELMQFKSITKPWVKKCIVR
ncbi:MAG: anaerobic ribonucleoside-triphosphate reductase activating protein [Deltaproteobacteria bacterium]|nr:anaerobic ribonucleoside-triphosphate reductase activating protein [Deltaproteobacteria bacterium]MBW2662913.1 anaerobic ribonucleoside-triphosphate reductase activating protein [Deltaproteobacteria bacterium]